MTQNDESIHVLNMQYPVDSTTFETKVPQLALEVVKDKKHFAALSDEWNALVKDSTATIFQCFDWQYLWWKYFGAHPSRRLHLLLFRHYGRLVGVVPFFQETNTIAGVSLHRRLRLLGCGVAHRGVKGLSALYGFMDYLDIICLPEYEIDVAHSLITYLEEASDQYDEIELTEATQESFIVRVLKPQLDQQNISYTDSTLDMYSRVSTSDDLETYVKGRSRKYRRQISKARRTFPAESLSSAETEETVHESFEHLVHMHQRRWNKAGYPGLFSTKRFLAMQKELIPQLFEQGWLWFKTVQKDDQCIAVRLGFVFNDRIYDYMSGFDGDAPDAKHGPGTALMVDMIDDAIQLGCSVDLLRGDEGFKFELTSDIDHSEKILISNRDTQKKIRVRISAMVERGQVMMQRINHEGTLLGVHYREYGLSGLSRYASFRLNRVTQIARKILGRS